MKITSSYAGGMRFDTDIRGHQVVVDVPENQGGGDTGPMPPELVAMALGTCVGIYAVNYCQKHGISAEGLTLHTDWDKVANPPRIGALSVTIELLAGIPVDHYEGFMKTVEQCMVHNTLHHQPEVTLTLAEGVTA